MNIELHIEELVLHGFKHSDRYEIGEAVERELIQLFEEQGVPPSFTSGGDTLCLDAEAFEMGANSKAPLIGARVAQAVYGGFRR